MTQNPQTTPRTLDYSIPASGEDRWGKGFLAACGTFLLPGLGHVFAGRTRRGLLWLAASLFSTVGSFAALTVPGLMPLIFLSLPAQIAVFLAALVDAFLLGRSSTRPMLGRPEWRYLVGVLLLAACIPINRVQHRAIVGAIGAAGGHTYVISTVSMQPTIQPGDRLLTHRAATLRRWDLVVFHPPGRQDIFTQRIVGLPGEKVEIVGGRVQINDVPVMPPATIAPYTSTAANLPQTGCQGHPITLGPGEYYLLGDNSARAFDSRGWTTAQPGH